MAGMFTVGQSAPGAAIANPYGGFAQKLGDKASTAYDNYFGTMSQPFKYQDLPSLPGVNDFSADRQRVEDAIYGKASGTLDQRYKTETDAFNQQMANQGVDIGSERYQREKALFDQSRNEAYNDARYRAILAGGDEQSRLFGMGLQARQQGVNEQLGERQQQNADLASLIDPYFQAGQLSNQVDIANQQNASNLYGIDTQAATTTRGQDINKQIADQQSSDNRYGIDTQAATTNRGQDINKAIAEMQSADTRYGIDQDIAKALADRISGENIAKGHDETTLAGYSSQKDIANLNNEAQRKLQELINKFTGKQNDKDRAIQSSQIAASSRGGGGNSGNGGGASLPQSLLDAAAAAGLI